jgi:hypothetical protein
MDVASRESPVTESGVRAALKKLSFRRFNGWSSSRRSDEQEEGSSCDSNTGDINGHCNNDVPTEMHDDDGANLGAGEIALPNGMCYVPLTEADLLAVLSAMNEANRSDNSRYVTGLVRAV